MSLITPNLIVGSFEESFDTALLEDHGVTHILNVADELDVVERVGRTYLKCAVPDDDAHSVISDIFDASNAFIVQAHHHGGRVFVHCLEGKSRSVCVCLAYLVCMAGHDFQDALATIFAKRDVDIYPPYLSQTEQYCRDHLLIRQSAVFSK